MRHVGGRPDQTVEEEADSEVFYDNVQSTPQNGKFFYEFAVCLVKATPHFLNYKQQFYS